MIYIIEKLWGNEEWLVNNDKYCCKLLNFNKSYCCSDHYHKNKDETFYINYGKIKLKLDDKYIILTKGEQIRIVPKQKHKIFALEDSQIIEVSTHHEDSDSYRLDESSHFNI